jgi:hypothetical protein
MSSSRLGRGEALLRWHCKQEARILRLIQVAAHQVTMLRQHAGLTRTANGVLLQNGHCALPGGSLAVWWCTKHSVHTRAEQHEAVFMLGYDTVQMGHSCSHNTAVELMHMLVHASTHTSYPSNVDATSMVTAGSRLDAVCMRWPCAEELQCRWDQQEELSTTATPKPANHTVNDPCTTS